MISNKEIMTFFKQSSESKVATLNATLSKACLPFNHLKPNSSIKCVLCKLLRGYKLEINTHVDQKKRSLSIELIWMNVNFQQ
jgi:hypothetical protein